MDTGPFLLRVGGFALALIALVAFPRYEKPDAAGTPAATASAGRMRTAA